MKLVTSPKVRNADNLQWFLTIGLILLLFFAGFIATRKVDLTVPAKVSSRNSFGVSKIYAKIIKEHPEVVLTYKQKRYKFKALKYDYQYFDSIKITVTPDIDEDLFYKSVRFSVEQRYFFMLLFTSRDMTKKVIKF
jgi:hypothetical protein